MKNLAHHGYHRNLMSLCWSWWPGGHFKRSRWFREVFWLSEGVGALLWGLKSLGCWEKKGPQPMLPHSALEQGDFWVERERDMGSSWHQAAWCFAPVCPGPTFSVKSGWMSENRYWPSVNLALLCKMGVEMLTHTPTHVQVHIPVDIAGSQMPEWIKNTYSFQICT